MRSIFLFLSLITVFSACNVSTNSVIEEAISSPTAVAETEGIITDGNAANDQPGGTIYAIELTPEEQSLVSFAAATAVKQSLFTVPENAWLGSIDYQPERDQFVLAYAPPPPAGEVQFGFTHLYLWQPGDAEPTLLLAGGEGDHLFFNPIWSADGETIYYSHVEPVDVEAYTFTTSLKRYHLETGEVENIAENGIWPALSPDGQKIAYVHIDPNTTASSLMLADADGQNKLELLGYELFAAVDAPVFAPDGSLILFSAADSEEISRPWWEIVLGIQTARAHTLPSDWYQLPLTGGEPERLTEIGAVGLYGRFAPDNAALFAFASQDGLFMMSPTGENVALFNEGSFKDSLSWSP